MKSEFCEMEKAFSHWFNSLKISPINSLIDLKNGVLIQTLLYKVYFLGFSRK